MLILTVAVLIAAGYVLGRWRPCYRAADWAHWQLLGKKTPGLRRWTALTIRSAENTRMLLRHPVRCTRAWRHRNDPPPLAPAPVMDPYWAAKRHDSTTEST